MGIYRDTWVGTCDLDVTLGFASGIYLDQESVRLCHGELTSLTTAPFAIHGHRGLPVSLPHCSPIATG